MTTPQLHQRIMQYHDQEKPEDGQGRLLTIRQMEEIVPGIVAVRDSLGELDLFIDPSQHQVNDAAGSPYQVFVKAVREPFTRTRDLVAKYGMVCVVEDRWHPFFARRRATFDTAREAVKQLFKPVEKS